jgi:hypothetical protein
VLTVVSGRKWHSRLWRAPRCSILQRAACLRGPRELA